MAKKNEKLLLTALARFKQAQNAESSMCEKALEDIKFANDDQWDKQTLQERKGRPSLTVNKIAGVLKQIRGDQRKSQPSIKVKPIDSSADPKVVEILDGLIKNIEYNSGADAAYDTAFDQAIEGGWGFFRINTDYASEDTFNQDICIKRITNPFNVHIDPSYTEADASDMEWAFISEVMDKETFKEQYPKAELSGFNSSPGEEKSDWWTEDGIRIAEYWYKEPVKRKLYELATGDVMDETMIENEDFEVVTFADTKGLIKWADEVDEAGERIPEATFAIEQEREVKTEKIMWCKITESEVLDGPTERPGRYIPIILVMGEEVYMGGERHLKSAHRHARDAQKVYNWMISTAVETVSMAPKQPWLATPEQIQNHENQWNVAHRRPMPYLLYNNISGQQMPSRQQGAIPDSGATQERMQAADDIKATTGKYDASLGANGGEQSGRQVQARQIEGDMSTFVFMDNLERAIRHAGRILVDLIPYIYDSERIVRILGADGTEQFVPINKTVIDENSGEAQVINDVTQGKYDVVVELGPTYNTQREEATRNMIEIIKNMPSLAPQVIDLIVKNMDWPGSQELYERIRKIQQGMGQQGQEQSDPQEQLDMKKKELEIRNKQLENAKDVQSLAEQHAETSGQEGMNEVAEAAVEQKLQRLGILPSQQQSATAARTQGEQDVRRRGSTGKNGGIRRGR